jgi:hypothetical protein
MLAKFAAEATDTDTGALAKGATNWNWPLPADVNSGAGFTDPSLANVPANATIVLAATDGMAWAS